MGGGWGRGLVHVNLEHKWNPSDNPSTMVKQVGLLAMHIEKCGCLNSTFIFFFSNLVDRGGA